jgi:hypothetical protein
MLGAFDEVPPALALNEAAGEAEYEGVGGHGERNSSLTLLLP